MSRTIISSSFIPDHDTFVTGGTDGYISLFNYRSAEITKLFYISPYAIRALTTIYSSNLIAIGSGDCITILNPNLGKTISKIYAHESLISNLYYDYQSNMLISDSINGTINTWDLSQPNKIPIDSLFLNIESNQIAYSDYNNSSNKHYVIDYNYNVYISSLTTKETISFSIRDYITSSDSSSGLINFIKGNICNPNHFFISTDNDFFEYDIRKYNTYASHIELAKLKNIFIDSESYLCVKSNEVELYSYNRDNNNELTLDQKWTQFRHISHSNFDINREMVLLGMENGDVFYNDIY